MNLALFLPKNNSFYRSVYKGIRKGFQHYGINVMGGCGLLDTEKLNDLCTNYKIDCVFEMNRSRNELCGLSNNVKHISWIVDQQGREINYYQGSDITYFFDADWCCSYISEGSKKFDWLSPGFDEKYYKPLKTYDRYHSDFSFVGHIPNPWSDTELSRVVKKGKEVIFFETVLHDLEDECHARGGWHRLKSEEYTALVRSVVFKYTGVSNFFNQVLQYDIEARSARTLNRTHTIASVLAMSNSLRIYGSENWNNWKLFTAYYESFLFTPQEINEVYHTSKLNIHDGVGVHFRSIDCIGSGAVLLYKYRPVVNNQQGALWQYFEPGKHFVLLEDDNVDTINMYLNDDKRMNRIRECAHQQALKEHTWCKRLKKVVNDMSEI